jgi:hypothetical protein
LSRIAANIFAVGAEWEGEMTAIFRLPKQKARKNVPGSQAEEKNGRYLPVFGVNAANFASKGL